MTRTRDLLITNFLTPRKSLGNLVILRAQDAKHGEAMQRAASRLHPKIAVRMHVFSAAPRLVIVTLSNSHNSDGDCHGF